MGTDIEIKALKSLKKLYEHRNEIVICTYIRDNKTYILRGKLIGINYLYSIKIANYVLRFIGNSSIIKSVVLDSSKEVLYENNYLDDWVSKEDISYLIKEIFGGLITSKEDVRYKIIKDSVLYINLYYLEEWIRLVNNLLDNNKKFVLSMILEYLRKLANGESIDKILINLNNTNLDNKYKVIIKKCLYKYYVNSDNKLSLKRVD